MDPSRTIEIEFVVERNYDGWRLDRYLCAKLRRLSRARVQRIIETSMVCERRLKASSPVRPGLTFRLRREVLDEPETPKGFTELHLDDALLVIDKPAGLPVHPSARYHLGTLVNRLRERHGPRFAEPAHRLDRETSGVLVCARSTDAMRALSADFRAGRVRKTYLALTEGAPVDDAFEVDAPIAEGSDIVRIAVRIDARGGKPSRTRFAVLRRFARPEGEFALLAAYPETGRQHQIRVHLKHVGHPIVGDKIYGPSESFYDRWTRHCLEAEAWTALRLERHALHAAAVELTHPSTGAAVRFEAPWPEDLAAFLPAVTPLSQSGARSATP